MTGFASKRQAALDKLFEVENELGLHYDQKPKQEPVLLQCTTCGTVYAEGVPPQVPEQEPVEDVVAYHPDGTRTVRISPKRPWVGLTDEDYQGMSAGDHVVAFWVDRILKEKNAP